jgi:hypothetical protein
MEVSGQLHVPETVPDTHCIGGWVDPRAGRDIMEMKTLLPYQESRFPKLFITFLLIV